MISLRNYRNYRPIIGHSINYKFPCNSYNIGLNKYFWYHHYRIIGSPCSHPTLKLPMTIMVYKLYKLLLLYGVICIIERVYNLVYNPYNLRVET